MKLLELFGGIGACSKAFKRLKIPIEIADYVEIDKYAVASYNAINGTDFETQDITKWDKDIDVDFIMHGSPCQDFSVAGKNAGGDKGSGTRSSLMYETIRIVNKLKPKYVLWENVKNLLSKKHIQNFKNYISTLSKLGYNSYYQVLNAKDYGIPQNRERVFTLSIRQDIDNGTFQFPKSFELKLKLKDILENEVDEMYYLSDKQINRLTETTFNQGKNRLQTGTVAKTLLSRDYKDPKCIEVADFRYDEGLRIRKNNCSPTITRKTGEASISGQTLLIKNNTKQGYLEAKEGDGIYTNTSTKRGTVQKQIIPTITSFQDKGVVTNNLRIRKLIPKECWRLMGFDDEDFDKAKLVNSDSQLYKQAGNSIVVNVLEKILENLFLKDENEFEGQMNFEMLEN